MKQRAILPSGLVIPRGRTSIHTPALFALILAITTTFLVGANFRASAATSGDNPLFHIGDRVQTIGQAAIWVTPPFAGRFAGNQSSNAPGVITDGPVRAGEVWSCRKEGLAAVGDASEGR
jgi:hypothetical protein